MIPIYNQLLIPFITAMVLAITMGGAVLLLPFRQAMEPMLSESRLSQGFLVLWFL